MSLSRRQDLLTFARQHNVLILEDDHHRELELKPSATSALPAPLNDSLFFGSAHLLDQVFADFGLQANFGATLPSVTCTLAPQTAIISTVSYADVDFLNVP